MIQLKKKDLNRQFCKICQAFRVYSDDIDREIDLNIKMEDQIKHWDIPNPIHNVLEYVTRKNCMF